MGKKIKIVVVGAGYMVNEHLKVLSKFKNVELSGIFSRTKKGFSIKKNIRLRLFLIHLIKCKK